MSRLPSSPSSVFSFPRPGAKWAFFQMLLGVLALTLSTRAHAVGSLAELDRDNGLPNAQLGAPLGSFQGLEKTEDLGRFQTFKRPSDKLRFGRYDVQSITYNFFKERLYSIVLTVAGKGNVKGINKLLEQSYGKDHTNDTLPVAKTTLTVEVHEWAGAKAYCLFKYGSELDGGELRLIDKPTWDQLEQPRREKLQVNKAMLGGSFLNGDLDPKAAAPVQSPAPASTSAPLGLAPANSPAPAGTSVPLSLSPSQ